MHFMRCNEINNDDMATYNVTVEKTQPFIFTVQLDVCIFDCFDPCKESWVYYIILYTCMRFVSWLEGHITHKKSWQVMHIYTHACYQTLFV